jgi:hypothetical protein
MTLLDRVLFVAWQHPISRRMFPVARLVDLRGEPHWEFAYIRGARTAAEHGFQHFLGMENLEAVYTSSDLPPLFSNRLMHPRRPDHSDHMRRLGLSEDLRAEIPILARSEGRRATDTIEVFGLPTYHTASSTYRFWFFARGVRHVTGAEGRIAGLQPGDELAIEPDPANPVDRLAIRVLEGGGGEIGYLPNTLVEDLHELRRLGSRLRLFVERVNPAPAAVQLRLLCRLEASFVDGYVPFTSARYQPISPLATPLDVGPQRLVG